MTSTKKETYIGNKLQLQKSSSTFIHKIKSFVSAASILSRSPMADKTIASLDKLTCTAYVDFGKFQAIFSRISWSKNDSNYLDVKIKLFKKVDQRVSFGPKSYDWRGRFHLIPALEEPTGHCSRKVC